MKFFTPLLSTYYVSGMEDILKKWKIESLTTETFKMWQKDKNSRISGPYNHWIEVFTFVVGLYVEINRLEKEGRGYRLLVI